MSISKYKKWYCCFTFKHVYLQILYCINHDTSSFSCEHYTVVSTIHIRQVLLKLLGILYTGTVQELYFPQIVFYFCFKKLIEIKTTFKKYRSV